MAESSEMAGTSSGDATDDADYWAWDDQWNVPPEPLEHSPDSDADVEAHLKLMDMVRPAF